MTGPIATSREQDIRDALHERFAELSAPSTAERLTQSGLKGQWTRFDNTFERINAISTPLGQR